jgi:hypothetical protein
MANFLDFAEGNISYIKAKDENDDIHLRLVTTNLHAINGYNLIYQEEHQKAGVSS